jgi:hypothetical protein
MRQGKALSGGAGTHALGMTERVDTGYKRSREALSKSAARDHGDDDMRPAGMAKKISCPKKSRGKK